MSKDLFYVPSLMEDGSQPFDTFSDDGECSCRYPQCPEYEREELVDSDDHESNESNIEQNKKDKINDKLKPIKSILKRDCHGIAKKKVNFCNKIKKF